MELSENKFSLTRKNYYEVGTSRYFLQVKLNTGIFGLLGRIAKNMKRMQC